MKKILFGLAILIFIFFFGRHLLPSNETFYGHDITQPARIVEFSYNLLHGQFPPRLSPHMSFNMSYPVFTFYAPFSYWVTTGIHVLGFDIADSLNLSYLIAATLAGIGMYFFLRSFFNIPSSIIGGLLYASSPYMAVEIFVRGNLAEVWYLALLPWILYLYFQNAHGQSKLIFVATVFVTSFILTVHNIFSFLSIPLLVVYLLFLKNKKKNYVTLSLGLLAASYFLVPFIGESAFTRANAVARITNYHDHFLCPLQIWTTNMWGYGASVKGCMNDGMSFMIGKVQVIFAILGLLLLTYNIIKKREKKFELLFVFIFIFTLVSTFMTTYASTFIWDVFGSIIGVFQFPWRFLIFTLFGFSFLSAYFFSKNPFPKIVFIIPFITFFLLFFQSKYFFKPPVTKTSFNKAFTSDEAIRNNMAYYVAEYLPSTADYIAWRVAEKNEAAQQKIISETKDFIFPLDSQPYKILSEKSDSFERKATTKSQHFLINVHYLPYWKIQINGKNYTPTDFDFLGRPLVSLNSTSENTVHVYYQQTLLEIIANIISVLALIATVLLTVPKQLTLFKKEHT
jgi:hypothetical protein